MPVPVPCQGVIFFFAHGRQIYRTYLKDFNYPYAVSALGLGCVETRRISTSITTERYALIAAMSGWMPMMFITRVRL